MSPDHVYGTRLWVWLSIMCSLARYHGCDINPCVCYHIMDVTLDHTIRLWVWHQTSGVTPDQGVNDNFNRRVEVQVHNSLE